MAQTLAERNHLVRLARLQDIADKAMAKFGENNSYYETWVEKGTIKVEIIWGDWKHDHLYANWVLKELGAREYSCDITEEDGSDCYSAIHTYII